MDTLEVLAHERYEQLLRGAGVLNEQFVDRRTRSVLRQNAQGETVVVTETETVSTPVVIVPDDDTASTSDMPAAGRPGAAVVTTLGQRTRAAEADAGSLDMTETYTPLQHLPRIQLPVLRMTRVQARFQLADITDLSVFRKLGEQIGAAPESELRRMKIGAKVIVGMDGLRRTELVTTTAVDRLEASQQRLPLNTAIENLTDALLASPVVPPRPDQVAQARPIIREFLEGLGSNAEVLSAYSERAAARLVVLVTDEHRKHSTSPSFQEVVELVPVDKPRTSARKVSNDRTGPFSKSVAYNSFRKSLYGVDWFDSAPERRVANIVDDSKLVRCWVRLQTGDLPIKWRDEGDGYNPDLVIVDDDDTHWLVEIKADGQISSDQVQRKREAARRWANYVNASDVVKVSWRYLLVSETDIDQSKGSWAALKRLGS